MRHMNILYDFQTFSLQNYGGISRYHAELIAGINKTLENNAFVSALFSNNIHLKECGLNINHLLPDINILGKGKLIYYMNKKYSKKMLFNNNYDIFHPTYYDPYFIPYLGNKPFVVTFHDMIYEKFSKQFGDLAKDQAIINHKKLLAEKSTQIIAVSEHTKNDIIDLLKIHPDKIKVIYHGNSLTSINDYDNKGPQAYLLYVGSRSMAYKNFRALLASIHSLLRKYNIKLLCAGGGKFTKDEQEIILKLGINLLVRQIAIDKNTLTELYRHAIAFIFPSLYEGFGIPILEAFACNCPCLLSNTSSLPEVAGNAAIYMDPTSIDSMKYAVEQIINDSNLREMLIRRGRNQLARFSWKQTTDETLSLYQSILN